MCLKVDVLLIGIILLSLQSRSLLSVFSTNCIKALSHMRRENGAVADGGEHYFDSSSLLLILIVSTSFLSYPCPK